MDEDKKSDDKTTPPYPPVNVGECSHPLPPVTGRECPSENSDTDNIVLPVLELPPYTKKDGIGFYSATQVARILALAQKRNLQRRFCKTRRLSLFPRARRATQKRLSQRLDLGRIYSFADDFRLRGKAKPH